MKTVLLTGATGFVGTHLSRRLLSRGWNVKAAIRSREGVARLVDSVEGHIVGPINGTTDWDNALKDVDIVIHLAARVHVMHDTSENPLEAYREVNVRGTRRLLDASVGSGVRRFIFMSSVKAVGDETPVGVPFTETDSRQPQDAYGVSKAEAEQIVLEYSSSGKIETTVLRPPMVYGPGVKANFWRLMRAVDAGLPLPFKSVRNKRSMVYVQNLVDAVMACCEHPAACGQVFFVADDRPLATSELIQELARALGKRPRLVPAPLPVLRGAARVVGMTAEMDRLIGSLVVSTDKIKSELGWRPPWSVSEGILDTVNWYRIARDKVELGDK